MTVRQFGLSRRTAFDGGFDQPSGARAEQDTHPAIPLPSGSITSPVTVLKSLNLTQAILDGLAVVIGLFFLCALFGSVPLAIGMLIFASF